MKERAPSPFLRGALAAGAREVLEGNWTGAYTRPGPHLYPHQWSWDSAFVAIGWARIDEQRAREELRSLFRAQWANGLVPHMVFSAEVPPSAYFPGPSVWRAESAAAAPAGLRTSGIAQPPVHATAAWRLHRLARDSEASLAFLRELAAPLEAWHSYLHRERARRTDGLVAIRHPWESGQDNSPMWDEPLRAVEIPDGALPAYERVDLKFRPAEERATVADFDAYLYIVLWMRERDYDEERLQDEAPFAVADPLFNAALVRAELDLAQIVAATGGDPGPPRERAARVRAGLDAHCWDEPRGMYLPRDLLRDRLIDAPGAAGLVPLLAGDLAAGRAQRLVETLTGPDFWDGGHPVPTYARGEPEFSPVRYWRGPAWVNVNWLLHEGLRAAGFDPEADRLREGTVALVRDGGFAEYFDPDTGRAHGAERFSWTAALALDLSAAPPES